MQTSFSLKKNPVLAIAAILVAAGSTGCGSVLRPNIPTAFSSSFQLNNDSSSSSTGSTASAYTCPSTPNVLPNYDSAMDGTGRYSACASTSSTSDILVHGQIAQGNTVCIFPAQVIDAQHIYTKPDPQGGTTWSQCLPIASPGVYATFAGITYNAVFIVTGADQQQMAQCLAGGNYFACPTYSFGQFRP